MMWTTKSSRLAYGTASLSAIFLLAACGGGSTGSAGSVSITGTAAVGAPLVGAAVTAICQSSVTSTGTTQADGTFAVNVAESALPCAIRAQPTGGGQAFYAMTTGTSSTQTVNITPLTTLALALAVNDSVGGTLQQWFVAPTSAASVANAIAAGQAKLGAALTAAGYTVPSPFEPITATFTPSTGNAYDDLLESLMAGIAASNSNFAAAQTTFVDGGGATLPAPKAASGGGGVTSPATINASLAKTYNLAFYVGGGEGCGSACTYTDGQLVTVVVDTQNTMLIQGKTLNTPFFRSYGGNVNEAEVIWVDGDLEYALTNNKTGNFSEINVGDASRADSNGIPKFLGQIRAVQTTGNSNVTQYAGSYAKALQFHGPAVAWTGVTIETDGSINFTGGAGPSLNVANISKTTDYNGCCDNVSVESGIDINGDNLINYLDTLRLYRNAAGQLESIQYQLTDNNFVGVLLGTPTPLPAQGSSAMPAANNVVFYDGVNERTFSFGVGSGSSTTRAFVMNAASATTSPNDQFQLSLSSAIALMTDTTYSCKRNNTGGVKDNVTLFASLGTNTYKSVEGGRCEVVFTQLTYDLTGRLTVAQGRLVADLRTERRSASALSLSDVRFHYTFQ